MCHPFRTSEVGSVQRRNTIFNYFFFLCGPSWPCIAITSESLGLQACTDEPKLCFQSSQWCKDKWKGYEGPSGLASGQVQTYWRFSHITASSAWVRATGRTWTKAVTEKGSWEEQSGTWFHIYQTPKTHGWICCYIPVIVSCLAHVLPG